MKSNVAFVFDLDKTIGYFTQLAIFIEGIEEYFNKKLTKKELFKLFDLYPMPSDPIFSKFLSI